MTLITIREDTPASEGITARIMIEGVGEFPVTVQDPFDVEEERRLEWYFERWLEFPFTRQIEAQEAARSVQAYGEQLFTQLFRSSHELYAEYRSLIQAGIRAVRFAIAGSPAFHRLHWEALKDPALPKAFALETTMLRQNLRPQTVRATLRSAPTVRILVVVARPRGRTDVGYRTISRPLIEALQQSALPTEVDILPLGSYRALVRFFERHV